jgi:hypothetical protein
MNRINRSSHLAQSTKAPSATDGPDVSTSLLTRAERRHVALAALEIQEQRFRLRLAQLAQERRYLLMQSSREAPER